jgi:glucose dehydrogenase
MRVAGFAAKIALGLFALASASLHAEDWPMYGRNLSHTFSNPDSGINPSNVANLQLAWTFPTGGCGQRFADRRRGSRLYWLLGWLFLCA